MGSNSTFGSTSLLIIVIGTLVSGAANSLFTKYQDNQCVKYCDDPAKRQNFEQPAIQSLQMFAGEFSILLVYYLIYNTNLFRKKGYTAIEDPEEGKISLWENAVLSIPAVCDLCATTLLNIALVYIPVSVYQMSRGSSVLFVAIFSVLFLKRRISKLEWISLFFVTLGIAVVGLSGSNGSDLGEISKESSALIFFGISLVLAASVFQAMQFVSEEHILAKNSIMPLKLVYCEGFYGFLILAGIMVILNFILGAIQPASKFEHSSFNIVEAVTQFTTNREVLISSIFIMISISAFNFFGISITQRMSATSRTTVDTCRTVLVWIFAMLMGWESFKILQFIGFVLLAFGTLCFNGVLVPEEWRFVPKWLKTPSPTLSVA